MHLKNKEHTEWGHKLFYNQLLFILTSENLSNKNLFLIKVFRSCNKCYFSPSFFFGLDLQATTAILQRGKSYTRHAISSRRNVLVQICSYFIFSAGIQSVWLHLKENCLTLNSPLEWSVIYIIYGPLKWSDIILYE